MLFFLHLQLIQEPTDEDVSEEEGETGPAQKVSFLSIVFIVINSFSFFY